MFSTTTLDEAAALSSRYLVSTCKPDGQFVYRVHLDRPLAPRLKYNVLRHCGAMYALARSHEWRPHEGTRDALARAGRFLREQYLAPLPDRPDLLAPWSPEGESGRHAPRQAKLGGAGLGLVALLSLDEVIPDLTPLEDLRRVGRFLLYMQKQDGSFFSKFIPSHGGRQDVWTSLYYPGEAALGLLMLYRRDPSPVWLEAATKAIGYLARIREGWETLPADHWALLATAKLLQVHDGSLPGMSREQVFQHALQICQSILHEQISGPSGSALVGGFVSDGRTTPTATRLEGLLAALEFLPPRDGDLRARVVSAVHRGMDFLLRAQVRTGPYAGAMPRAIQRLPLAPSSHASDLNPRVGEVRIDYVQHALCAMIQYLQTFHHRYQRRSRWCTKSPPDPEG